MNNTEDTSNVRFHFLDGNNAVLFPLIDIAAVTFELSSECVRDAGDFLKVVHIGGA